MNQYMYNVNNSMAYIRKMNTTEHPFKALSSYRQKGIPKLNNCSLGQPNLLEMHFINNSTVASQSLKIVTVPAILNNKCPTRLC